MAAPTTRGPAPPREHAQNSYSNSGYWWWYNQGAHTTNVSTSQVNASYSSKYSYDVTGSSFLRTKLVPVPPPPILEVRIRELMDIERAYLLGNPDKANERGPMNKVMRLAKLRREGFAEDSLRA